MEEKPTEDLIDHTENNSDSDLMVVDLSLNSSQDKSEHE